jgi:tetratricopeptide (TPR) repeat protein
MSEPDTPAPEPDELRRLLLEAAANDDPAFAQLCRQHRETIRQEFPAWCGIPEPLRHDRPRTEQYVQGIVAVARFFAEHLGQPELMQRLSGGGDNPLTRWQRSLKQAQSWMAEVRYRESVTLLTDALIDTRRLTGSGADALLPMTFGLLGECYFQCGEAARALAPTEKALEICTRTGDAEGCITYLGNLYEMHRYLGEGDKAAGRAEQLAAALEPQGRAGEAGRYRRQAQRVRAGEPRNRVVVAVDGKRFELDEVLQGVPGQVQFAFERNRLTLRPSEALVKEGGQRAGSGAFAEALALFREAAEADRFSPQPHYEAALALLCLHRYSEAAEEYEATEALAPGWLQCRSDLWLAEQLAAGAIEHEIFQLLHALSDGPDPPAEKVRLAERGLAGYPKLALLHLAHGNALRALERQVEAEAAYRRGLRYAEEPDVKTRLLVSLGSMVSNPEEKRHLLRQAVELQGNLVAAAMASVVLAFD